MISKATNHKNKVTAIILTAGNSTRFGKGTNKNFEKINGKMVLSYSLEAFDKNNYIEDIIVAVKETDIDKIQEIISEENISKSIKIVVGGKTRSKSVLNCLKNTDSDIVIIHDGARPAIKQEYINKCIESIKNNDGVTIGVKSKDTIKIVDDENVVVNTTNREKTYVIQTPQCFKREILLNAHEKYKNETVTDDCGMLEKDGYKVKVIEGDYTNIKITTIEDLDIVKHFLNSLKEF